MAPKRLSDAEKQDIITLYRQPEETTSTLASRYGVSNSTISRILKQSLSADEYDVLVQQKRAGGGKPQSSAEAKSESTLTTPSARSHEVSEPSAGTADQKEASDEDSSDSKDSSDTDDDDKPKSRSRRSRGGRRRGKGSKVEASDTPSISSTPQKPSKSSASPEPAASEPEQPSDSPVPSSDPSRDASETGDDDSSPRSRRRKRKLSTADQADSAIANNGHAGQPSTADQPSASADGSDGVDRDPDADPSGSSEPTSYRPGPSRRSSRPRDDDDYDDYDGDTGSLAGDLDDDLLDADDDFSDFDDDDDDDDDDALNGDGNGGPKGFHLQYSDLLQINPLSEADLPRTCYLVIDRSAELITCPLQDFAELGQIPDHELTAKTLPVFDNHRVAKRFANRRTQRIVKVPDGQMLLKTMPYLQAKGITRMLLDGRVFSLSGSISDE